MSTLVSTERGRVGTVLVMAGALLLALASVMFISQSPAGADQHCIPPWPGLNPATNNGNNTISGTVDGIFVEVSIIMTGTNEQFTFEVLSPDDTSISGIYVQQGDTHTFSGESGLANPPHATAAINHVQICGAVGPVDPTTTTTVADPTTTTVAGPGEPTTTTTVADPTTTTVADPTTTTVAGPDQPELPETGAGHFLALMAGALGLLLVGSGSLVIASDRRRQFNA